MFNNLILVWIVSFFLQKIHNKTIEKNLNVSQSIVNKIKIIWHVIRYYLLFESLQSLLSIRKAFHQM